MAARPHGRHLAHGDGQARSSRLGLGLTAPAPHHQPRGLLHPRVRKRLDFGCADNLFVPGFIFDFKVAQRCLRLCPRSLHTMLRALICARPRSRLASSLPVLRGCKSRRLGGGGLPFCVAVRRPVVFLPRVNSEGRCVRSKLRVRGSARRGLSSGNSNVADTTVWSVIF